MTDQLQGLLRDLPDYLAAHVMLVVVALAAGAAISLPLAVLLTRVTKLRWPVLSSAGVIQTVPSLALLALMVPVLEGVRRLGVDISSFGFLPAVIALTLYSILPMLRNTVAGITQVDPAVIEASRGVGMTGTQRLMRVELPLAAPVILAGVRTATVWVVGIATLATPIGQECLGNYIFTGLQTRNTLMILWGVVAAAGLALCMDLLIGATQRAAQRRSRPGLAGCAAAAAVLLAFTLGWPHLPAIGSDRDPGQARPQASDLGTVRIGAKTFTEQYLLARVIEARLNDAGYQTQRFGSLGSSVIFNQLASGELDVYVEYSGTLWANQLKRQGGGDPDRVLDETAWWLAKEKGVRQIGPLGFENAYALAMRREQAASLGIQSVEDLAEHSGELSIGGDYEFFGRPEWATLRDAYGLAFEDERTFDSSLMYEAVARGEIDVIAAFSSDGRVAAFDLVVLDEPRHAIPPYDAVLLVGPRIADDPRLIDALRPLVRAVPLDTMQAANEAVDVHQRPLAEAAEALDDAIAAD
ncbi:MAG: ABC transporter permease/substrate-binding protein [Phycisphaeraceae bacterium]